MDESKLRSGVAAFVRAPLIHFLLLGGLLFGGWSLVRPGGSAVYEERARLITVTAERIGALREGWLRKWQRSPTEQELRAQIEALVREEILSREAIALGLDQDDTVVRRRLAQKMDSMVKELLTPRDPTDQELTAFLEANPERYRQSARFSFRQVFFSTDRRRDATADAEKALATLRDDPKTDADGLGDAVLLPASMTLEPGDLVERRFGRDFVDALANLPTGRWAGPVRSTFGLHLVHVSEKLSPRQPELSEVRAVVARDYAVERRETANRELYRRLREQYRVEIDEGEPR